MKNGSEPTSSCGRGERGTATYSRRRIRAARYAERKGKKIVQEIGRDQPRQMLLEDQGG